MSIIESIDEPAMKFIRPMFAVDVMKWVRYCDKLEERIVKLEAEIKVLRKAGQALMDDIHEAYPEGLDALEGLKPLYDALDDALPIDGFDNEG